LSLVPTPPTWDEVLAECEAAAEAAEQLLASRFELGSRQPLALAELDLRQLNLPALPLELRDRAHAIHRRQLRLQEELLTAMGSVQREILMNSPDSALRQPSVFLDLSA
jgi:hypothetical protein